MVRSGTEVRSARRADRLRRALRDEEGSAVVEFPLLSVLLIVIALAVIQASVIMHTRNTLVDASVQGAHHAALIGNTPEDGAQRTRELIAQRLGPDVASEVTAVQDDDGTIDVQVHAVLPLVGLYGPSGMLVVDGRAISEESW